MKRDVSDGFKGRTRVGDDARWLEFEDAEFLKYSEWCEWKVTRGRPQEELVGGQRWG